MSQIKPEQVPTECLPAYSKALGENGDPRQAIAAALNAWPGAYQTTGYNTYFENLFDHVVIPLTQEASDAE